MKKVLITGAAGDVGAHLRRELAGRYRLRLSDRRALRPARGETFARADIARLADALRTRGQGEELVDGMTLEAFTKMLGSVSEGIGPEHAREYFKAFADEPRRRGQLELYRSGDFSELEAYEGKLAALGVPFLALWGEEDPFAPVAGAQRFAREVPGARVQVIPGTGHFVYEDAPQTAAQALAEFLGETMPR